MGVIKSKSCGDGQQKTASNIKKLLILANLMCYILCVSTHKTDDMFSPQIDGLLSVAEKISKEAKRWST